MLDLTKHLIGILGRIGPEVSTSSDRISPDYSVIRYILGYLIKLNSVSVNLIGLTGTPITACSR
jgi:hypothetical protein